MRNFAVATLLTAVLVLAACGSGDEPVDAGNSACEPIANTGCPEGQKCSLAVEATEPMLVARTTCVPDGATTIGSTCSSGFANPGPVTENRGFDNCVGGSLCVRGVCTEICQLDLNNDIDTCPAGQKACGLYAGIFDDIEDIDVGVCDPVCSLFQDASCGADEACYLSLFTGITTCSSNLTKTSLGESCSGLNSCDAGMGCVLQSPQEELFCTPYCNTETGLTMTGRGCATVLGGQATDARCLQINTFYDNVSEVKDQFGMCVDCSNELYTTHPLCAPATGQARPRAQLRLSRALKSI